MHFKAYRIKLKDKKNGNISYHSTRDGKTLFESYPSHALVRPKRWERQGWYDVYVEELELHVVKTYNSSGKEAPNGV